MTGRGSRRRQAPGSQGGGETDRGIAEESAVDDDVTSEDGDEPPEVEEPAESSEQPEGEPAEVTAEKADDEAAAPSESEPDASADLNGAEDTSGGLRNRRSSGKISLRKRKRSRGGVALDD